MHERHGRTLHGGLHHNLVGPHTRALYGVHWLPVKALITLTVSLTLTGY